ncbi:unnamed protein product [Phytomonas sp. EM1]|nr:unnamed protein product [Phytomonas sp. EM1]|eukprot:CCW60653.1 unnamed protein product [Phytomonas sp. isolate EM1]
MKSDDTRMPCKAGKKRSRGDTLQRPLSSAEAGSSLKEMQPADQEISTSTTAPQKSTARHRDPIYRIMHALPRSDILEIIKCKFGREQCERAAAYFKESYMQNPLRRLRLQIGCDGPTGLNLFFPMLSAHRHTLRTLDLSRNKLTYADIVMLCELLGLSAMSSPLSQSLPSATSLLSSSASTDVCACDEGQHLGHAKTSALELINFSYNVNIGNDGAVYLMQCLSHNSTIRAVQLKHVGIDDTGACSLAPLLRARPPPQGLYSHTTSPATPQCTAAWSFDPSRIPGFFLDLNENCIGPVGTCQLRQRLPSYVSLSLCKQRVNPAG